MPQATYSHYSSGFLLVRHHVTGSGRYSEVSYMAHMLHD